MFFGSAVRHLALPLTAVIALEVTPAQMGILVMLQTLPTLVVSLFAGVWIDRARRRPIMVAGIVLRALLLALVPLLWFSDALRIGHLYVISCALGAISVVSIIAARAYLPWLLPPEQLVRANSRIEVSASVAQFAGPGIGGLLVAWLTAPLALALDAIGLLAGAYCIATIRRKEPVPEPRPDRPPVLRQIREGLRLVLTHGVLRPIVLCGASHNFCSQMIVALQLLYMTRVLEIGPALLGLILAASGPSAMLGASMAPRIAARLGTGRALMLSQILTGIARLLIPLAAGPRPAVIATLAVSELLLGFARPLFNVTQISLRQQATEPHLQGRVNASFSFLLWGVPPLGAAVGGLLATYYGMRPVLLGAAVGVLAAALWLRAPGLRKQTRTAQ